MSGHWIVLPGKNVMSVEQRFNVVWLISIVPVHARSGGDPAKRPRSGVAVAHLAVAFGQVRDLPLRRDMSR
jgi:hypothetical protein